MRRLTVILFVLSLSISSKAQYKKFIQENKQWVVWHYVSDLTDIRPGEITIWNMYFKGTTELNGEVFNNLYRQRIYISSWYNPNSINIISSEVQPERIFAYLKEDTINQKVYDNTGDTIYDFSLDVGDSLYLDFGVLMLDSIGNIELNSGEQRRVFYYGEGVNFDEYQYIIEGIGGMNGIVEPFWYAGLSGYQSEGEILCYMEDSVQLYGECNQADFLTSSEELLETQDKLQIFPNPSSGQVNIRLEDSGKEVIVNVYTSDGMLYSTHNYTSNAEIILNLESYSGSIVFVQVISDKNIHDVIPVYIK